MQRHQDTNGSGRWLGLLGVSALAVLAGCDWIGGGSAPVGPPPRPGAEKAVQPSASIPPAPANPQHDAGVVGNDERTAPAIGSIVAAKGGQKAQRDAIEKEQADRDRKEREERLEREAADKDAKGKEKEQGPAPVATPVGAPPAGAGTISSDQPPVSAPVPPPGPVTAAPIAPPSAAPPSASPEPATTSPPVPTAPTPPADPNKAFTPPPDWSPPAAPTPPADPNKAEAPQPVWGPVGTTVAALEAVARPTECAVLPTAEVTLTVEHPASVVRVSGLEGDIGKAQSGAVPFSALKSPPFDGSLQVAVIQFGRSSTGLDGADYAVLARVAEIQRENGGTVRIVAHAAQDRDNLDMSRRRALAIARELRRLGVPTGQIVAEAASDDEPIYQTSTARGLAANRRADVFIDF